MYLTANPIFHARIKHVSIDFHFVLDKIATKALDVWFISEKDQLADEVTKPLVSSHFHWLIFKLNG